MNIAYFSPLPPLRSGIADYSAELVPHLVSAGADLTLFVDGNYAPRLSATASSVPTHSHRHFERWREDHPQAVPLYHIGNNVNYHAYIYQTLLRHPGVVVLHDYVIHHLILGMTLGRNNTDGYVEIMRRAYGEDGARRAQEFIAGWPLDFFAYPLVEHVLDSCRGVIAHSRHVQRLVHHARPALPATQVNMPFSVPPTLVPLPSRDVARAELGLTDRLVLASFGWVASYKRIHVALRAFARLLPDFPQAIYLLVGQTAPDFNVAGLTATLGLGDAVTVTSRTDLAEFIRYMLATDIALNLRFPTAGETSATLVRLLGLGVPTLVSNVGGFTDFPDDCCVKVDVDGLEEDVILAFLRRLAGDEPLRRQLGENARRYVARVHAPQRTARDYLSFLQAVASGSPVELTADPAIQFLDDLGSLLARLDINEHDTVALRPLAQALSELGLCGAA